MNKTQVLGLVKLTPLGCFQKGRKAGCGQRLSAEGTLKLRTRAHCWRTKESFPGNGTHVTQRAQVENEFKGLMAGAGHKMLLGTPVSLCQSAWVRVLAPLFLFKDLVLFFSVGKAIIQT